MKTTQQKDDLIDSARKPWTPPMLESLDMRETADGGIEPGEASLPGFALSPS